MNRGKSETEEKGHQCALCGVRFSPDDAESSCGTCPLRKACAMVKCPNCGYEFPP